VHLRALGWAVVVLGATFALVQTAALRIERQDFDRFAFAMNGQRTRGLAVQRAALRHSDVLMIYGASEVANDAPFHARDRFRAAPTGFTAFTVGERGTPEAMTVQNLAALGDELRGRRIAVFLSLEQFVRVPAGPPPRRPGANPAVRGTFSPLHAASVLFATHVDAGLQRRVATRLNTWEGLLDNEPLLQRASRYLSRGSDADRVRYALLYPIGRLMVGALELQDHITVLSEMLRHEGLPPHVARAPESLDWARVIQAGELIARRQAVSNPFGFSDSAFRKSILPTLSAQRGARPDSVTLKQLRSSRSWDELDFVISAINAVGAEALIICGPMKGLFSDYRGTSLATRRILYDSVAQFARDRGVTLLSFAAADQDPWFLIDQSHPSAKGWAVYDEALDAFYRRKR
jgi:D-alanine transfer protein